MARGRPRLRSPRGRPPPGRPDDAPGGASEFLGFRLIGELGRGAFGRVYLAREGDLASRPVAAKVGTDLFDESQTLARFSSTNIVPIHSLRRVGPLQAVCMPYFGATTLGDVYDLETRGTLPVSGRGLLAALDCRRFGPEWPGALSPSVDEETVPSPARSGSPRETRPHPDPRAPAPPWDISRD